MKTVLLILAIGILSCSAMDSPEKQLYDCWTQSYKVNGVDLASEIHDFENDLIKNGYLKDSTWTSYKTLIDSLSRDSMPRIGRTIKMFEFSKTTFRVDKQCYDSVLISKIPKLAALNHDFQKGIDNKDLGYQFIYARISSTVDITDFNTDLYKTWINWILISNSIYSNLLKDLIPKEDPNEKTSITIKIDGFSNYFIDNKTADLKAIQSKLKKLSETDSKLRVELIVDKSVSMDKVVEIMNLCKQNNLQLKLKTIE